MIDSYYIASLAEFYDVLKNIDESFLKNSRNNSGTKKNITRMWFRGHSKNDYNLVPTLFRNQFCEKNTKNTYTQMNLKEDYRYQHMKARAFHNVDSNPVYRSEWQEIYQHHFGRTRLMDWTESAKTALLFALEPYIDTRNNEDLKYKRNHITPCIWVLDPLQLNRKVYKYMAEEFPRIMNDPSGYYSIFREWDDLCAELASNETIYFDGKADEDKEISGILSLCAIEDYRKALGVHLEEAVKGFEFNPFYYLALKIYADALPFIIENPKMTILPPIALLHPYHSNRIRTQRGAFTMFPNYMAMGKAKELNKNRGIDVRFMEQQDYISDCLKVIYILDSHRVAKDLMISGERRSEIYPDIQTYADIIETQEYYY